MACSAPGSTIIEVRKGETLTLELEVVDDAGAAVDITTATLHFTVKHRASDSRKLISKSSADAAEIEKLAPLADGKANIYLVHDDTKDLRADTYVWDAWLEYPSGAKHPLFETSPFVLLPAVTTFP